MTTGLRVLIADDHRMLREGVLRRLEEEPGIEVVGEAGTREEALCLAKQTRPDIILLDIRLAGASGLDVARELRDQWPDLRIVILTDYDFDQYVSAAVRVGVDGYLLKDDAQDALVDALRQVAQGGVVLPPKVASKVVRKLQGSSRPPRLGQQWELTLRELEIVELLYQGMRNVQIAERLGISVRTVEAHVSSILAKLNAERRADVIRIATERGLIK
jgi:DNA-binding NarL/FixJ family response regulator